MLGRLVEGSIPPWIVRFAADDDDDPGSESTSISRFSTCSPSSDKESATERGIDAERTEALLLVAALLAPGNGIPALAPVGPMALCVDRMMKAEAGQPSWLSGSRR